MASERKSGSPRKRVNPKETDIYWTDLIGIKNSIIEFS